MKKTLFFLLGMWISLSVFADYSYQQSSICIGEVCSIETCHVTEHDEIELSSSIEYPDSDMSSALYEYLVAQGEMRFADWLAGTVCISENIYMSE